MTELCELAIKYGSDKVPVEKGHSYTPVYHELFKDRKDIKKILEIGIGYPEVMGHVPNNRIGASLFMWRDYFPQAQIYACDIKEFTLINEDRIKSFKCDQSKKEDLEELAKQVGGGFDLIIDDGSHLTDHQILSAQVLIPLLKKDGIYIIEDVDNPNRIVMNMKNDYDCEIKDFGKPTDCLVILRNKNG